MLLAASESAVTKNPRFRLTMRRSSSVKPFGFFQSSMSRCMFTSCGIQWLAQAARYLSQAHRYLNGTSWLTSDEALMTRLSSMRTRRKPFATASFSAAPSPTLSRSGLAVVMACARMPGERARPDSGSGGGRRGVANSSSKLSMLLVSNAAPSSLCAAAGPRVLVLVHRAQLVVQIIRSEIDAVVPGDGGETVVQVEIGKAARVAQRLEILPVQVVGQVHHALPPIVEFEPDLVVAEIPRFRHMSLHILVMGQLDLLRAVDERAAGLA